MSTRPAFTAPAFFLAVALLAPALGHAQETDVEFKVFPVYSDNSTMVCDNVNDVTDLVAAIKSDHANLGKVMAEKVRAKTCHAVKAGAVVEAYMTLAAVKDGFFLLYDPSGFVGTKGRFWFTPLLEWNAFHGG